MDTRPRVLSLFSGGGGLDIALRNAIGARTVCYVENDLAACAVLVAGMEEGRLDSAPVWSDVRTFNAGIWRGIVDVVAGGFPCTDLSIAGRRAGIDGERSGLWFEFARCIGEIRPRFVFIENVPDVIAGRAAEAVLGSLASMGFDARWGSVRASDAGAPHRRERVFILAYRDQPGLESIRRNGLQHGVGQALRHDADRRRLPQWPPGPTDDWSAIPPEFWPAVGDA